MISKIASKLKNIVFSKKISHKYDYNYVDTIIKTNKIVRYPDKSK